MPNQGEVFYHILRSRITCDPAAEDFWWTRLHSPDQREMVKRLLSRPNFRQVLGSLSDLRADFVHFRTGMVGTIIRLRSDDEVLHGFNHITDFWLFALGGDRSSLDRVDLDTIQTLQRRSPALSMTDRATLEGPCQQGLVFRHFSSLERDRIWERVLQYRALIPSLDTFFDNLRYLMALSGCLKMLVQPDYRQTLAEAFRGAFYDNGRAETDRQVRCNVAYRQVVLCAARLLDSLRPACVLAGPSESKVVKQASPSAEYDFATLAYQVGFRSPQITKALSDDPDRAAARQSLLLARPDLESSYAEQKWQSCIDDIAAVFARLRRVSAVSQKSSLLCEGPGEPPERRKGCPDREAHDESRRSLFFDDVHRPDPVRPAELTALFVRRDIYLSFWGKLDLTQVQPPRHEPLAELPPLPREEQVDSSDITGLDLQIPPDTDPRGDGIVAIDSERRLIRLEDSEPSSRYSSRGSVYTVGSNSVAQAVG